MKDNVVSVRLWGREIAKLEWQGGYRPSFGRQGAVISFHPDYVRYGWDLDPIGPYNHSIYLVQKGLSDRCRATEYEGLPASFRGPFLMTGGILFFRLGLTAGNFAMPTSRPWTSWLLSENAAWVPWSLFRSCTTASLPKVP